MRPRCIKCRRQFSMAKDIFSRSGRRFVSPPGLHATVSANKVFTGPNPPYGALISYYLKDKPDDRPRFKVQILDGTEN